MADCPTTDKIGVYPTWEKANKALQGIKRRRHKNNTPMPNHIYSCKCGNFHLTSQVSDQVRHRREMARKRRKQESKKRL